MFATLLLLGGCHHAPPAATPPAAPAEAAPAPVLSPIHFSQGSSHIAEEDQLNLATAQALLLGDPSLTVELVGHADGTGDPEGNRKLSEARAQFVRSALIAGGVDAGRITVAARGEDDASGNDVEDRRVDFTFARAGGAAAASPAPAPAAAPTETAAEEPKAKKSKGAADDAAPPAREEMKPIGLADLDSFFGRVQAIRSTVWAVQDGLVGARTNLLSALNLAQGVTVDSALANLVDTAKGSVHLTMQGTKPKLTVSNSPSPQVDQAVTAVNGMLDACLKIATELPKLQQEAMGLVSEAQALPAKLPSIASQAGASPMQIPKMAGAVKTNVVLTTKVPNEIKSLIDEGASTINLVKSTFAK